MVTGPQARGARVTRRDEGATKPRRRRLQAATGLLIALLTGAVIYWHLYGRYWVSTNDAYVAGNIVPVQAQTTGTVADVWARRTEYVHAGEVLATLQGVRAHLTLRRTLATLGAEVRKVRGLRAHVQALRLEKQGKIREQSLLQHDLNRYTRSLSIGAVSAIRVQDTEDKIRIIRTQVAEIASQLRGAAALVRGVTVANNPLVRAAAARVEAADLAWQRRVIRAPISGFVAQRAIYPGSQVASGHTLFTIVPLTDLWVVANVKETRMGEVRPGDQVILTSYYYGRAIRYRGEVLGLVPGAGSAFSILPPENATGNYIHIVERVPVRIGLIRRELLHHPLRPGLSMIAHIHLSGAAHSILAPLTKTPVQTYQTHVYQGQLRRARRLAMAALRAD